MARLSAHDPRVAKHELTELGSGERVISERLPGVRSVAIGFWISAGSRDERVRQAPGLTVRRAARRAAAPWRSS